jgi:hypothetical protein
MIAFASPFRVMMSGFRYSCNSSCTSAAFAFDGLDLSWKAMSSAGANERP